MKNQRLYLDYNATSPLASSVLKLLASGDFPFANPSSQHSSGKLARKQINQVSEYLKSVYSAFDYDVLYHSGATEAINLFSHQLKKGDVFIGFKSDHPAVTNQHNYFEKEKVKSFWLNINSSGDFPLEEVQKILTEYQDKKVFLNFTWVHNETGVVWPLTILDSLIHPDLFIHVDAVQSVAKTKDFLNLNPLVKVYTFSGHKFGALKGIGFSFVKKDFKLSPMMLGGPQQNGQRSGTENPLGVMSIMHAHKEWSESFSFEKMKALQDEIISTLEEILKEDFLLVAKEAKERNVNTVDFIHKKMKADALLMQFDLNGIDVSSGSACSSGQVQASATLKSMGHDDLARNSIRLSFSPFDVNNSKTILTSLKKVFKK